jgi:hypothetical protein
VAIEGTGYANDWDLWVYPAAAGASSKGVLVTDLLDEAAVAKLESGGSVLLTPRRDLIAGDAHGSFDPIFWNRMWFPNQQQHTLGILCDPKHPALAAFPTDSHSNWQWWDLQTHSKPIVMSDLPKGLFPIVQVIDDWNTCRKLGLVFEAKVGLGKLIVSAIDLQADLETRPVARQLRRSLLDYMAGPAFKPEHALSVEQVKKLLTKASLVRQDNLKCQAPPSCLAQRVLGNRKQPVYHEFQG